ncbi:DNA end protector protein [Acinetobacter phage SH-Ab 15599]|nr:DNA end protector protein [Acinetobacter phage SH-Ab 15599]
MATAKEQLMSPLAITRYWDKFFKANPYQQKVYNDEAVEWFRKRVSKDLKVQAEKIIDANSGYKKRTPKATARLSTSSLYTFEYKAESPGSDLGFYDRFPMCFFFNSYKSKEGKTIILGLNLHYLTPMQRAQLLKALMKIKNAKGIDMGRRLNLEWQTIVSVAGTKIAEAAVHAYRADRFLSHTVEVAPEDYIVAAFLRSERWVKPVSVDPAVQSHVRRMIRKGAK